MTTAPTPWFSTSPLPAPRGRLLLVSYHFPPSPAVGGLRWQKMARVAAERGWELDVVAVDPSALDNRDDSRLADLPPGVRIFGVPLRKTALHRFERGIVAAIRTGSRPTPRPKTDPPPNLGTLTNQYSAGVQEIRFRPWRLGDYRRAYHVWANATSEGIWAVDAARLTERLVNNWRYSAVVTSGPPHLVHAAVAGPAHREKVPHVIDMRDPWSLQQRLIEGLASPLWFHMSRRKEKQALSNCSLLVCNTQPFLESMTECWGRRLPKAIVVHNGWDPEPVPTNRSRGHFRIAFAGSIYLDRSPEPLFRGAADVIHRRGLTPSEFSLEFMGHVHSFEGQTLESIAGRFGIADHVVAYPSAQRNAVMEFLSRATVLVSLPQDSGLAIPSKIFEYMLFAARILVFAEPSSATWRLFAKSDVAVLPQADALGIADVIDRWYGDFAAGVRPPALAGSGRFSRRVEAIRLLEAIEDLSRDRAETLA